MGSEIAYLLVGAIVLLLATLSDHPRFRARSPLTRSPPPHTGVVVGFVRISGTTESVPKTSGSVSPEPFQTPAPGVARGRDLFA